MQLLLCATGRKAVFSVRLWNVIGTIHAAFSIKLKCEGRYARNVTFAYRVPTIDVFTKLTPVQFYAGDTVYTVRVDCKTVPIVPTVHRAVMH